MTKIKDYKIIAHRGIHDNIKIPENSLLAFKKSIIYNIPIELDIQLTKDNQLVVFHDDNLERMTTNKNKIEDLTLSEIKKLYLLNTKEKIPTLEEILNLVNNQVLIDIEIKAKTNEEKIINLLLNILKNYNGEILLKSFNPKVVKILKKKQVPYPCGLLIMNDKKKKLYNLLNKTSILIKYCNPDFLAFSKKMTNKKLFNYYKNKLPIYIWTIKNKEELLKYKKEDYTYICNNLPY